MSGRLLLLVFVLVAGLLLGQGFDPGTAPRKMNAPPGLTVSLLAAEPLVRQPVAIDFDDQGRLWAMQYLQYPNPAGLKRVKVDRYSRTAYDRVPPPPPAGPRGADRLTILHDPAPDGRMRRGKDFLTGLNLASAFAFGHGGVFVLQVPYLLFYPDRNGDDVPDDDPDVLLTGFGMEDAHSVANSLTWGPDGWLYGCQGSTVTASIRGIEFQQGVWRYHPVTRKFELFCEGGGNSWGLDFDRHGNLLYSTNHGGFVLLHGVQGGYYWKAFGKHGPLHNPFTYGWFDHAAHLGARGGHVSVGGIVYRGDSFPASFRERYLAADLLGHNVYWHEVLPAGSTFRTQYAGNLLVSNDTWFAPSDVALAPDGSVCVADWHDSRTAHPDPDAEWDRSNGRIYRIAAAGTRPYSGGDLRRATSRQLVALLSSRNDWVVRRARRVLAERRDPEVIFPLRELVRTSKDEEMALEALWALYVSGGFSESFAEGLLDHANPHVRRWTVRFLGDERQVSSPLGRLLVRRAQMETDAGVRSQLASSARRFPPSIGLPLVCALLEQDRDRHDLRIPLLCWWAIEHHVLAALPEVVAYFSSQAAWKSRLTTEAILPRLVRRLAVAGTVPAQEACARILRSAPAGERPRLLPSLEQGLGERRTAGQAGGDLARYLLGLWHQEEMDATLIRVRMRLGAPEAHQRARALARDPHAAVQLRVSMLQGLAEMGSREEAGALLDLVPAPEPEEVRLAALDAVGRADLPSVGAALVRIYPELKGRVRTRARGLLLGRHAWALEFVAAAEAKRFEPREVSPEELQALALHRDAALDARVARVWGRIQPPTAEEKLAEVRRLNNDLRAGAGDARSGRELFTKLCATCHKLHGEGADLGPDLTLANRTDRNFLLVSLIDPSAVVRKEYLAWTVQTTDGRVLTGLVKEEGSRVVLVDAKNEKTMLSRNQIEKLEESRTSLMPEGLLKDLKPAQLRDLFAYLQSPAKR